MKPLSGKTAIVTGASAPRGIGRAIAMRLARDGASVVVTDIDGNLKIDGVEQKTRDLLAGLISDIEAEGGQAIAQMLDVTLEADVSRSVKKAVDRFGRLDILVNNAGSLAGSDNFLSTTSDQWTLSYQVNLLGPAMLSKQAIPEMRKVGGGTIINIGSTGSLGAEPGYGAYTAMKHGLIGLTKTIAAEFGVDGIQCNAVCPGYISTDMHVAANQRLSQERGISVPDVMEQRYENVALRKAGDPEDVASAVGYLVGPQATYVTGIAFPVAGGVPFGI